VVATASLASATTARAQSTGTAKPPVEACLDKAAEMDAQAKYDEVADGYLCAAEESAKLPSGEGRAARFRGLSYLARAWAVYTRGVTRTLGRANLDEALRQIDLALPFLSRPDGLPGFDRLAEGWRLYLLGVKAGLAGKHAESRERFEKARSIAMEVATYY